ncbi:hypothetical protein [Nocardia brasiliensis]|uniref:hypothetical protein n=1 Tax=Nocardia brasiliensis TaxID=37326 RepID=UPI002455DE43|nr:hypothetical protein [Nocardia brasiliensis]
MPSTQAQLIHVAYTQAQVIDQLLSTLRSSGTDAATIPLVPGPPVEHDATATSATASGATQYGPDDPEPVGVRFVTTGLGETYERRPDGWQLYINDEHGERWGVPPKTWAQLLADATPFGPLYVVAAEAIDRDAKSSEYSLADAAEILKAHGIRSGQRRLKARLYALGWTDGLNLPTREGAPYLVVAEPANPGTGRNAVVRVRETGVRALVEDYGIAWQR